MQKKWCWIVLFAFSIVYSDILKGSGSVRLSGPATKEQTEEVQNLAKGKLKNETLIWLSENKVSNLDTTNALYRFHIDNFINTCVSMCKKENEFKGKLLTMHLILTYDQADSAVAKFNTLYDAAALEYWTQLKRIYQGDDYQQIYSVGVKALFNATAHLGPSIPSPDNPEKLLTDEIRTILQNFFDRIKVSSNNMILQGKIGQPVNDPPEIRIIVDSSAVEGIPFTGRLQNSKVLFSAKSDTLGKLTFSGMKIPFVQNGTLFYVSLDLGKVVNSQEFISAKDFGIILKKGQDQNFIFKIARPNYTMDFKTSSVSQITIPPDFVNASYIKTFLKDSCYLQEVSGTTPSDLIISLQSQVSKYDYDETEETSLKVSCQIKIKGLSIDPPRSKEEIIVFEKRYEQSTDIPYGLFFWEANVKIREAVKAAIENL